jgi:hypothetical protein
LPLGRLSCGTLCMADCGKQHWLPVIHQPLLLLVPLNKPSWRHGDLGICAPRARTLGSRTGHRPDSIPPNCLPAG